MVTIAHISDPHFETSHRWGGTLSPSLSSAIHAALEQVGPITPEILLVSGDFTCTGSPDEFTRAREDLGDLLLTPPMQEIQDFLFVPGNHDFPWRDLSGATVRPDGREVNYRDFLRAFSETFSAKTGRTKEQLSIPPELQEQMDRHLMDCVFLEDGDAGQAILLVGLNSVKIDSELDQGKGFFGRKQLDTFGRLCAHARSQESLPLRIMCAFHHHVVPVAYIQRDYFANVKGKPARRCSVTLDARAALECFQKNGVSFAFHGHQHQPAATKWRDLLKQDAKTLHIVAAGSVGAERSALGDISVNHFYVHQILATSLKTTDVRTDPNDSDCFSPNQGSTVTTLLPQVPYGDEDCILARIPPDNSVPVELPQGTDDSTLFYLFLNVVDCKKTRDAIKSVAKRSRSIDLCAMYDLYGRYDVLVKFRERKRGKGLQFKSSVIEHLTSESCNQMWNPDAYRFVDVTKEHNAWVADISRSDEPASVLLIRDSNAYLHSTWNTAVLEVLFQEEISPGDFFRQLRKDMEGVRSREDLDVARIIRSVASRHNETAVFEILMTCRDTPLLTRLSTLVEGIISPRRVDKSTHLVYFHDERLP